MRVLFLSKHSRVGSNVIRGKTVSKQLKSMGVKCANVTFKQFRLLKPYYLASYDIFVFVKRVDLEILKLLKAKGKTTVADTIDNFDFEHESLWSSENVYTDYYIANTRDHLEFLHTRFGIEHHRLFVIEHHHSNLDNVTKKVETIKVVGFIGAKEQFAHTEKLEAFCKAKDLELYFSEKVPSTNEDAVAEAMKLDCFIVNVDKNIEYKSKNIYDFVMKFKPAQKILLPFSLGVPTVLAPYSSYIDAIAEAGYDVNDFLMADNEDELVDALTRLLNFTPEELQTLIRRQKEVAACFTLEKIGEKYIAMFKTIEQA